MKDVNEIIEKLNEEQKKPVLDTEGAVLVIAGAGSGKTRVLTSRIAYLIAKKEVSPYEILAITFTNKAANEMKERLTSFLGDVSGMWISTIHSMCVKILRKDADKIGYSKDFTIYDETDKDKVLKRVFADCGIDPEKLFKPVKNYISLAKNECLSPEEFKEKYADLRIVSEVYAVYAAYEDELALSNAMDFDDLLFKTYILFKDHSEVADYYANKFRYIHVDEFQDTNTVQFAIIQRMSVVHGNIFVVGDDDQSIYGWRGAKIENILNFDDIYRGAKIYKLERNYRSTKSILRLANCIIKNNSLRRPKELWTDNSLGASVKTFVGTDENNEATYCVTQIKDLIRTGEYAYSDFAVFMRINAISRAFEQEFTKYGIPYRVFGGFKFFERKEVKDVLAYLKIMVNPNDNESFIRAVSTPKRGIGDKTLTELKEFAVSKNSSMLEAVKYIDETTISKQTKIKLFNFKMMIDGFYAYSKNNTIVDTMDYVLENTAFMQQFEEKTEENLSRKYNISELKNTAEQFAFENQGATLSDYLSSVTLSSETDDINDGNAVTLATIHSVKGLEYPVVFVAGLDEKVIPISRMDEGDDLEEERRLMYVAVTRAKERLYLTRANSRYMYGNREYMVQSRFLKEAQEELSPATFYKKEPTVYNFGAPTPSKFADDGFPESTSFGSVGYSSGYAKTVIQGVKPVENKNVNTSIYKSGTKVKHPKFGVGTVITTRGEGDNLKADVAFPGIGIKTLAVKYAPMEILK